MKSDRGAGERRAARQSRYPRRSSSAHRRRRPEPRRRQSRGRPALAEEAGARSGRDRPERQPPVCKILDFGKFRFLEQKKSAEQRKRQKIVEIKEIKLRPGIDDHDYEVKMRSVRRFFEEGDKVKVTLRFRGREMAHQDIGFRCCSG